MGQTGADRVYICEVVARDGFQNEARFVETADKIALIDALSATGKCQKEQDRLASLNPVLAKMRAIDSPFNEPTLASRRELECWVKKKNSIV